MLNFYDFEVFKEDWLVVIINPVEKSETIIVNDPEKLKEYYESHKKEIWVGYNNRRYDQYIMKAILCGFDPKEVSDYMIVKNKGGWQYSSLMNKVPMINFDVMLKNDGGLKSLEGFMGNDIQETGVPFDIDRKLTTEEIRETIKYCKHDVEQTIEVFLNRKEEFDAAMGLVKIFKLPLKFMGKTGAQRVAQILGGRGVHYHDEFDFEIVPTLRLSKYKYIADWYLDPNNRDYKKNQIVEVAGIPHTFAWGGLHGAPGIIKTTSSGKKSIKATPYYGEGIFLMADVTAYYPSLQLKYKFGYRNMGNPENFEKIHGENLRLKKIDKKARLPYKIADNAISGQLKDPYSPLYDPRDNNAITVNGQLLLLDLIEKLEPHIEMLVQSNTDGILIKLRSIDDYEKIDDIVWEWEQRTGMRMGFDLYTKVFQKDVNNYLIVAEDGSVKTKGAYTKSLGPLDFDLPIVNKAIVEFMKSGTPIEKTICECDELVMFQKIVKLTGKYKCVWHNRTSYTEKCFRVFASRQKSDSYIGKQKTEGATIEKFANTPEQCFIDNGNVNGKSIPRKLDKQWYINLAKERLEQFGVIA